MYTREDRARYGRIGALKRLSQESDWSAVTEAARAAGPNNWEWHANKIDPDRRLPAEQRRKMGEAARRAWYLQLGERSRRARAARRAAGEQA